MRLWRPAPLSPRTWRRIPWSQAILPWWSSSFSRRNDSKHRDEKDCFFFACRAMKRKRIVVMGFMGSMPIAGVIWQHVHYIVGLQRLGHDVYYVEDSARLPYNPQTFEVGEDYTYAAQVLARLANEFGFKNRWSFCARYLPDNPTAGLRLTRVR